jgi:hypothetical protein
MKGLAKLEAATKAARNLGYDRCIRVLDTTNGRTNLICLLGGRKVSVSVPAIK